MSLASIQKEIVQLNSKERAMLIDLLWDSLDEAQVREIEQKWASESEDRIDAFERGDLPAVDGPDALQTCVRPWARLVQFEILVVLRSLVLHS